MENLHIRLEPEESINSKRNILSAEINLLNIVKKIHAYRELRKQEEAQKILLKTKLKETILEMKKLKSEMPGLKISKIEPREEVDLKKAIPSRLEEELKNIKERLKRLNG